MEFVDEFDELGVLDGQFPDYVNPVKAIRITLKNASENWVILSEVINESRHVVMISPLWTSLGI